MIYNALYKNAYTIGTALHLKYFKLFLFIWTCEPTYDFMNISKLQNVNLRFRFKGVFDYEFQSPNRFLRQNLLVLDNDQYHINWNFTRPSPNILSAIYPSSSTSFSSSTDSVNYTTLRSTNQSLKGRFSWFTNV